MRRRRLLALSAAPLLGLAACTAIAGLDGDFGLAPLPDGSSTSSSSSGSSSGSSGSDSSSTSSSGTSGSTTSSSSSSGVVDSGPDAAPDAGPQFDPTALPSAASTNPVDCIVDITRTERRFCWDFNYDASAPATLGWSDLLVDSGSLELNGAGPTTRPRAVVATAGKQALLVWRQWASNINKPLTMVADQKLDLNFSLTVRQAGTYAVIGALMFDNTSFGIAVRPKACGEGVDCLSEKDGTGIANLDVATAFALNTRYTVHIIAERKSGDWSGTINVGGRIVATRTSGVFASGAGATPLRIELGVFDTKGPGGTTQVEIDDVFLDMFPNPAQDAGP